MSLGFLSICQRPDHDTGYNEGSFTRSTLFHLSSTAVHNFPVRRAGYVLIRRERPCTWRCGKMQFFESAGIDKLHVHEGTLRLMRSEVFSKAIVRDTGMLVLQDDFQAVSSSIKALLDRSVNLKEYLTHGLSIVSRLPDRSVETTQFLTESVATATAREALDGFLELGRIYSGEAISAVLSVVSGDLEDINMRVAAAVQSHNGCELSVRLAGFCRKVAAEYDVMATILSLDEASHYLNTRFTGNGRLVTLVKLLLRAGDLLNEDRRNLYVVKRGLEESVRSFSFLWGDALHEARRLLEMAKGLIGGIPAEQVDFWGLVDRMGRLVMRPCISLDAVVAVALAELGIVVNCRTETMSVLRAIAGESAKMTAKPVSLTNPGGVWVTPFRALTARRVVMALDGCTQLRMADEMSGVQGTLGLFSKCSPAERGFFVCEPLPYRHIDEVKSTMPKAFAALAKEDEPWSDNLDKTLHELASYSLLPDGIEVESAVRSAKENFQRSNVLAEKYVSVIFQVKRIVSVFTLALEQGRRFADVLYQYSLFMVHPDVSKVGQQTVREIWENVDEAPAALWSFIENVRLTYDGWMVYPERGSAGVRHLRRRHTHRYTVWQRLAQPKDGKHAAEGGQDSQSSTEGLRVVKD